MPNKESKQTANRLINEKSPYLLQHAYNPVDWHPWCDTVFEKAKQEDKPIFLSIGYSTCHWCHVMEKESFENEEIAKLMNDSFINIKVDREERPDIDSLYMSICQMMTGSGGWPLTIIMTPEKEPFFAASYIPRTTRQGRIGLKELIPKINEIWKTKRDDVVNTSKQISEHASLISQSTSKGEISDQIFEKAFESLKESFDEKWGGFGKPPKFPVMHNIFFLLRHYKKCSNTKALEMAEKTLQMMHRGGIYDHIGFGFARYSTDERWLIPHFEKMLYDQAQTALAYIEVFQATGKDEYKEVAEEIFEYVLSEMTDEKGAFYSAEDADTEGEEGKFYLWSEEEIIEILGIDDAAIFNHVFEVTKEGNFAEFPRSASGKNILFMEKSIKESSEELKIPENKLKQKINEMRKKLFLVREKRVKPFKDDKILVDWNALMIIALARGSIVFNNPKYLYAAECAMAFIFLNMRNPDGSIKRRYRKGEASIEGNLDDYAYLAWAYIKLYESALDKRYLREAIRLVNYMITNFWDIDYGGFFFTSCKSEKLIVRVKELQDDVLPSGNSTALFLLMKLFLITGDLKYRDLGETLSQIYYMHVNAAPNSFTFFLVALGFLRGESFEIIIAGERDNASTLEALKVIHNGFLPYKTIILVEEGSFMDEIAPHTQSYTMINGKTTVYICKNFQCLYPETDMSKLKSILV